MSSVPHLCEYLDHLQTHFENDQSACFGTLFPLKPCKGIGPEREDAIDRIRAIRIQLQHLAGDTDACPSLQVEVLQRFLELFKFLFCPDCDRANNNVTALLGLLARKNLKTVHKILWQQGYFSDGASCYDFETARYIINCVLCFAAGIPVNLVARGLAMLHASHDTPYVYMQVSLAQGLREYQPSSILRTETESFMVDVITPPKWQVKRSKSTPDLTVAQQASVCTPPRTQATATPFSDPHLRRGVSRAGRSRLRALGGSPSRSPGRTLTSRRGRKTQPNKRDPIRPSISTAQSTPEPTEPSALGVVGDVISKNDIQRGLAVIAESALFDSDGWTRGHFDTSEEINLASSSRARKEIAFRRSSKDHGVPRPSNLNSASISKPDDNCRPEAPLSPRTTTNERGENLAAGPTPYGFEPPAIPPDGRRSPHQQHAPPKIIVDRPEAESLGPALDEGRATAQKERHFTADSIVEGGQSPTSPPDIQAVVERRMGAIGVDSDTPGIDMPVSPLENLPTPDAFVPTLGKGAANDTSIRSFIRTLQSFRFTFVPSGPAPSSVAPALIENESSDNLAPSRLPSTERQDRQRSSDKKERVKKFDVIATVFSKIEESVDIQNPDHHGRIYVFAADGSAAGYPNLVKIGFTSQDLKSRKDQLLSKFGLNLDSATKGSHTKIPFFKHVEAIIHRDLVNYNCCKGQPGREPLNLGIEHYAISARAAEAHVEKWRRWIMSNPYDAYGNLLPKWSATIDYFNDTARKETILRQSPLTRRDGGPGTMEVGQGVLDELDPHRWDAFLYPTFWQNIRHEISGFLNHAPRTSKKTAFMRLNVHKLTNTQGLFCVLFSILWALGQYLAMWVFTNNFEAAYGDCMLTTFMIGSAKIGCMVIPNYILFVLISL